MIQKIIRRIGSVFGMIYYETITVEQDLSQEEDFKLQIGYTTP